MTATDVKSKFHTLIDNDEDVDFLVMLMGIVDEQRNKIKEDIANELSDNQLNRLRSTIFKYRNGGHFIDNESVKNKITKKWLTK